MVGAKSGRYDSVGGVGVSTRFAGKLAKRLGGLLVLVLRPRKGKAASLFRFLFRLIFL
jgi:hypothetical protein